MNKTLYIDNFIFWNETDAENIPDVSFIPPMARRRMSILEKVAISLASKIAPETPDYRVVFASQFGEWDQTIKLIKQFFTDSEMSPAGFSNSVHNAALGHLSLLTKNHNSYTSIAAGLDTLEIGLLESITTKTPTLFIYAEETAPNEYQHMFETPIKSHGCALFINNSGEKEFEFIPQNNDCGTLKCQDLKEFLEKGGELITQKYKLIKK